MTALRWQCPHGCFSGNLTVTDDTLFCEQWLEDLVEDHERVMHSREITYREFLQHLQHAPFRQRPSTGTIRFPVVRGWERSDRRNGSAKT